MTTAHKQS